jgi:hypothetical protein
VDIPQIPSDYTQKTRRVAYSGPAANLADHDPTVTMQEFLNTDRWIEDSPVNGTSSTVFRPMSDS